MQEKDWKKLLDLLKKQITVSEYEAWIEPIRFVKSEENKLWISVPTNYNQVWLQDNYFNLINNELNNIVGTKVEIEVFVDENGYPEDDSNGEDDPIQSNQKPVIKTPKKPKNRFISTNSLIPAYKFERFIVGENNEFAHAAAAKVAQTPGTAYNPLFIYGGVGLGKTHLMHAIGHHVLNKDVNKRVVYMTSEEFMNSYVEATLKKKIDTFRNELRSVDLLLLDDVQFLLDKTSSKNELFHTFNALHTKKKQVVISSDRTPKQLHIDGMDDRLTSRLGSGLDAEIGPPSVEIKQAILKARIEEEKLEIPNEIITFIASVIDNDIRVLDKAITTIIGQHRLLDNDITIDMVRKVLWDFVDDSNPKNVSFETILLETCNVYGISKADIKSKKRTQHINQARQVAMFLAREFTPLSFKEVGQEFGREHPTVMSGIKKIKDKRKTDKLLQEKIEEIIENLKRHH